MCTLTLRGSSEATNQNAISVNRPRDHGTIAVHDLKIVRGLPASARLCAVERRVTVINRGIGDPEIGRASVEILRDSSHVSRGTCRKRSHATALTTLKLCLGIPMFKLPDHNSPSSWLVN